MSRQELKEVPTTFDQWTEAAEKISALSTAENPIYGSGLFYCYNGQNQSVIQRFGTDYMIAGNEEDGFRQIFLTIRHSHRWPLPMMVWRFRRPVTLFSRGALNPTAIPSLFCMPAAAKRSPRGRVALRYQLWRIGHACAASHKMNGPFQLRP